MWAKTLSQAIGQEVMIQFEQVHIICVVEDSRKVRNRVDLLVRPYAGNGAQWVSLDRCTVPSDAGYQSLQLA